MSTNLTISQIEAQVQNGLLTLQSIPFGAEIEAALGILAPAGYRPVVQLEEDGRKKRGSATSSNWNPATGEVVIYFEPTQGEVPRRAPVLTPESSSGVTTEVETDTQVSAVATPTTSYEEPTEGQVTQCCEALAEAEKAGRAFIAFKWFRDEALAKSGHAWAVNTEDRQRVLAKAIETGLIQTSRIPNPRQPQFPTTTVALNRTKANGTVTARYRPVSVRGEPVSETLLRDRGER